MTLTQLQKDRLIALSSISALIITQLLILIIILYLSAGALGFI